VTNEGFAAAALLSVATFLVHTFIGGIYVARPLLRVENLSPASRWLNYYTWHITTILTLMMAFGFGWAAKRPESADLAAFLAILAAMLSVLSAGVALRGAINPFRFPSTSLFLLVAGAGGVGVILQRL
jgi:hypothetical protein